MGARRCSRRVYGHTTPSACCGRLCSEGRNRLEGGRRRRSHGTQCVGRPVRRVPALAIGGLMVVLAIALRLPRHGARCATGRLLPPPLAIGLGVPPLHLVTHRLLDGTRCLHPPLLLVLGGYQLRLLRARIVQRRLTTFMRYCISSPHMPFAWSILSWLRLLTRLCRRDTCWPWWHNRWGQFAAPNTTHA